MSHYPSPSPYQMPPMVAHTYVPDASRLIAPARRAGVMMWVLGGLALLTGGCFGVAAALLPGMRGTAEVDEMFATIETQLNVSPVAILSVMAGMMIAVALVYIITGTFVRRGSFAAAIVALIAVSLRVMLLVLNVLSALLQFNPLGACFIVLMILPNIVLIVWLIQSLQSAGKLRMLQMQQQMQYMQHLQQHAAYAQQNYGYGAPPSAPDTESK